MTAQQTRSLNHFARHLFLTSKTCAERKTARDDLDAYLEKMRKSILRMTLSYTDINKLKEKIDKLIDLERRYAKLFKPEDKETSELKNQIDALEQELMNEKQEKLKIMNENNEKVSQLSESLNNIKNQLRHLHLEKAKRHQRLKALEQKIRERIDINRYYS